MARRLFLFVWFILLVGCGGGGGGISTLPRVTSSAPVSPSHASPAPGSSPVAAQNVAVSIHIPNRKSSSALARRRPKYVSINTQSASVSVNGAAPVVANLVAGSPNCTAQSDGSLACTLDVSAPVGVDTFTETLYSGTNATGDVLSVGNTSSTIVAGQANSVGLTLDGVIASVALTLAEATLTAGTPAKVALTVNFNDASGAAIIGNSPFTVPVALSDTDTTGATALSATTLQSPADAASLFVTYSGKGTANAVIGASAGNISATAVRLTVSPPPSPTFNDYVTFGFDNERDVYNPNSTAITPASVPSIHLAWQSSLNNFNTQTQPVLATEIPGHKGVLFAGGASGDVSAFDALTGKQLWKRNLGQMTYQSPPCGSTTSYFGVAGTVAYDPASASLYVIDNANASLNAYAQTTLYHLDGATGNVLGSVNFATPAANGSELDFSHTAVTLNNGVAYVGTGSTCDISTWRGRVTAISVPAMTVVNTFYTLWDPQNSRGFGAQPWSGGGVWGWGGVAIDPSGNVLTGVGNADDGDNGTIGTPFAKAPHEYSGFAESLLELSPDTSMEIADNHPIPTNIYGGVSTDLDTQGTPVIFTPNGTGCGTMVALQGKSGELNLYDESGINSGYTKQFQLAPSNYGDSYLGDPAYSPGTGLLYADVAASTSPSLFAPGLIAINPGCGSPSVAWHAAFGDDSSNSAIPIPRAVPAPSAGGVILAGTVYGSGGAVWAIDAASGNLLNGGSPVLTTSGYLRMPPTIDGNWIFVLDNSGNLYGLTIDSAYPKINAIRRAADSRQRTTWTVTHR